MKKLIFALLFVTGLMVSAQIKGNGQRVSKTFPLKKLTHLNINLYGDIIVDASAKEEMTITGDENLLEYVDTEIIDGKMDLTQLKWIQPIRSLEIRIGAPNLQHIGHGTNGILKIKNINQQSIAVTAFNGQVILEGQVKQWNANAENGVLDAQNLMALSTNLSVWGYGEVILNTNVLEVQDLNKEASLILVSKPESVKGNITNAIKNGKKDLSGISYIRFKIKNNSKNRNQFYVVGPKPEGGKFSYGFPMMPGATRKENWTNGTKVYKVNSIGIKKLLVEIKAQDEGKTVALF